MDEYLPIALLSAGVLACSAASGQPPGKSPASVAAADAQPREVRLPAKDTAGVAEPAEPAVEPPAPALPTECADPGAPCTPAATFVERLCRDKYPAVALVMFEKHAPWARGYVRMREVAPVNTLGGPTTTEKLVLGEEVVILQKNGGGSGGMQVSGAGGYFVLRWDGTCVTLAEHELVSYAPGLVKNATIEWRYLDEGMKDALLTNAGVSRAREVHRKECRGAASTGEAGACTSATRSLNSAIVLALRHGFELPAPAKLPNWAP